MEAFDEVREFRNEVPYPDGAAWELGRATLARAMEVSCKVPVAEKTSRLTPARRWRDFSRQRQRSAVGMALLVAVAASAGIADATGALGTAQPVLTGSGQNASLALAPDPVDRSMLAIFRRPSEPGDALPVRDPRTDPVSLANGENLALARKAKFGALGAAWVIPADGGVCLRGEGNVNGVHTFGGEGCSRDVDGHPPYVQTLSGNGRLPNVVLITGLVPDGVRSVNLQIDGEADSVAVTQNVYMAEVPVGVQSTTFTTAAGTVVTLPGWASHIPQGVPIPCSAYLGASKPPASCSAGGPPGGATASSGPSNLPRHTSNKRRA